MKKIFGLIVVVLVFCSAMVFAGTAEVVVHEENSGTLSEVSYNDGKYHRVVKFHDGSGLRGEEANIFREAFSKIKERLPEKSYFEIVRFPEVNKYYVKFSDGNVYIAIGSGDTVRMAFDDLIAKFSKR